MGVRGGEKRVAKRRFFTRLPPWPGQEGEPLDGRVWVRALRENGSFAVNAKPPEERAPYRQRETAG